MVKLKLFHFANINDNYLIFHCNHLAYETTLKQGLETEKKLFYSTFATVSITMKIYLTLIKFHLKKITERSKRRHVRFY